MRWLKRDRWKAGITIAGMLLLLVLMVWVPVSAAGAYEGASGLATPVTGTVQATPTEDATVSELNKEKLDQEVQQLKYQNEQLKNQNASDFFVWLPGWLRTNAAILFSTLVVVIGGLIGLFRWFGDRRGEREKRAEERFQSAVTGLGDEKEGAKIGAAILLRTFLRPGYEQFYTQTFDLAVAHLRIRTSQLSEDPDTPLPLTTLRQALIAVFRVAFPLARNQDKEGYESLDATGTQLDNAYLRGADLKQAWMPESSLRKANLNRADLTGAILQKTDLTGANLKRAILSAVDLRMANLTKADLNLSDLRGANLRGANLREANLNKTTGLVRTRPRGGGTYKLEFRTMSLNAANLEGADLEGADLEGADLEGANLEDALSLKDTNLRGVKGLTKEQLEYCKAKGAIIDEDATTSSPKSPVSPSPPSQSSNDTQTPSAPPAQMSIPTPDTWYWKAYSTHGSTPPAQVSTPTPGTDGSNTPSSQPSNGAQPPSAPPAQESMPTANTDGSNAASSKPNAGA